MYQIELIDNEQGFEALQIEWNNLLKNSTANNIFLTWEWLFNWWKIYRDNRKKLFILVVKEHQKILGIAPLMRVTHNILFKQIKFLGTGDVCSDYIDFIIFKEREAEVLKKFTDYLGSLNSWDIIFLTDIPEQSQTIHAIESFAGKNFKLREGVCTTCPSVILPKTWEKYMESLSKKSRKHINYYMRKLTSEYFAEFSILEEKKDLNDFINSFVFLHKARWDKKQVKDGLGQKTIQFHRTIAPIFFEKGWLWLSAIKINNKTIASLYTYKYNNKIYFYQSGFDPEYATLSPGFVLVAYCIKKAIEEGMSEFDFIRGTSDYKYKFANIERKNYYLLIERRKLKNKILNGISKIKPTVKLFLPKRAIKIYKKIISQLVVLI